MDASSRLGVEMLEEEYRELLSLRASLEDAMNDLLAADPSRVISGRVNLWLEQVEAAVTQVEDELKPKAEIAIIMEEHFYKIIGPMRDNNDSDGTPARLRAEITKLRQDGKDLMSTSDSLVVKRPPERIHNLPGSSVDHPIGIESNISKVLENLQDNGSRCIGIYGMGGVGKTTLIKEIVERLKSPDPPVHFDLVISVVVSQQSNILKIQEDIAVQLGFARDDDQTGVRLPSNTDDRAKKLSELLSMKNFLLVLDDVWKKIELADIGVPSSRERNPKSKIVVTTRKKDVCIDMQCRNQTVFVRPLDEKQSWDLFCDHISDSQQLFQSSEAILSITKDVMRKCGGLPLAIKIVACAVGGRKHVSEWKATKFRMEYCSPGDTVRNLEEEVYELLKFSFDNLPKEIQNCFLFCALYPEDPSISVPELVSYWIGEGLLDYTNLSDFEQLHVRGRGIVANLKEACLLENGSGDDSVKMNDVVREMAIWLGKGGGGYDGCKFFIEILEGEEGVIDKKWSDVHRIMHRHNAFREIKLVVADDEEEVEMSPSDSIPLRTLMVRGVSRVIKLPESFFRLTTDLRVFVMSGEEASYEPMYLYDLPMSLFELKSLRHLNLSCLDIGGVPVELGRLRNLVALDLSGNVCVRSIPSAAILPLTKLHTLNLKRTPCFASEEEGRLTIGDLRNLRGLKSVSLHFEDNANDATELVDDDAVAENCIRSLGFRYIKDGLTTDDLRNIASKHSEKMEELQVYSCGGVDGTFRIDDCYQSLVYLSLCNVPITTIEASTQCRSLEQLSIISCQQLTIFPCLSNFPNLRSLTVMYCWKLGALGPMEEEEAAVAPSYEGELPTLPKLEEIVLIELLDMSSISSRYLRLPSLREMQVERCPDLKKLAIIPAADSNVMIKCDREWWESVVWEDQSTQARFKPEFL